MKISLVGYSGALLASCFAPTAAFVNAPGPVRSLSSVPKLSVASPETIPNAAPSGDSQLLTLLTEALLKRFEPSEIQRVLDALLRGVVEDVSPEMKEQGYFYKEGNYIKEWKESGIQTAHSFLDGVTPQPWWYHDDLATELSGEGKDRYQKVVDFDWMPALENSWQDIHDELQEAIRPGSKKNKALNKGFMIWSEASNSDAAQAYGADWRTLVLQDAATWSKENSKLFPKTVKAIKNAKVPCVEAFFARQAPNTGVQPHSDGVNFLLTSHLGVVIPKNKAWIEVGNMRKYWKQGKGMVFDTSFDHYTGNDSDQERYVLMFRVMHPDLTPAEANAVKFSLQAINDRKLLIRG